METDYQIERRLAELDKNLHDRYRNCVVVTPNMLTRYEGAFPTYTDHSTLHTLEIIDICNQLIGNQLSFLTADDLYVLLMGALLHDVGMGISKKDFERFKQRIDLPNQNFLSDGLEWSELIREYHQEFSALYVEQYAEFMDIPGRQYVQAIMQVCRGHRKTDLMDEKGYPSELIPLENRLIHLPYLAALLCLADELDVAADRNIGFLYDIGKVTNPVSRMEFLKHQAIKKVEIESEQIVVYAYSDDGDVRDGIICLVEKLDDKLRYCRTVSAMRSDFAIHQKKVVLKFNTIKEGKD